MSTTLKHVKRTHILYVIAVKSNHIISAYNSISTIENWAKNSACHTDRGG